MSKEGVDLVDFARQLGTVTLSKIFEQLKADRLHRGLVHRLSKGVKSLVIRSAPDHQVPSHVVDGGIQDCLAQPSLEDKEAIQCRASLHNRFPHASGQRLQASFHLGSNII